MILFEAMKGMRHIRTIFLLVAVLIAFSSLLVSHSLVRDLSAEEKKKMELFAEAYRTLNEADENTDLSLVLTVISSNDMIPIIVLDETGTVISHHNIDIHRPDSTAYLHRRAEQMRSNGNSIKIYFNKELYQGYNEVCYDESIMIGRLTVYPYIQLFVVLTFVLIAIFTLLSLKRAEQNRVWVGLSKETAHQLGTPISSLMAWIELLKCKYSDDIISDMERDIGRLETVADRFSKIGSAPSMTPEDVVEVVQRVLSYMEKRVPHHIQVVTDLPQEAVICNLNGSLFEWVVENLCKNAVDAMSGNGVLRVSLFVEGGKAILEVADTGKGVHRRNFTDIFNPGYTTKQRGWGLGLSLAKRIVEEYHKGKIYVKSSELGVGTVFRVEIDQ